MIKKVKLKYFQSHQDSQIQFGEGLNLIIGQSDSGKSAIVRAISCCVANRWSKQQVRTGHTYCQAYVQTQKGWVECQRGEGINKWKTYNNIQQKEYKSIGSGVPDQVPYILGMGQRNRGQLKQLPNFMFQLQKHYMLAQIDGKKATSNLVARMMDNAIGLGGMQDLIKNIASDLGKDKRQLTQLTTQISQIKSSILDEFIYNQYKNIIDSCNTTLKQLKQLKIMYDNSGDLQKDLTKLKQKMFQIQSRNIQFNSDQILFQLQKTLDNLIMIKEYQELFQKQKQFNYLKEINSQQYCDQFQQLRNFANRYAKLLELKKSLTMKNLSKDNLTNKLLNNQEKLIKFQQRFQKLKDQLGYCPLCEREFKK